MSSSENNNLMSSAGLIRYFDSEDSAAITINPKTVLAFSIFFGLIMEGLNLVFL